MKRQLNQTRQAGSGAVYKSCQECKKMRPEQCGLTAGDGQRWYCCERCLNRGERLYRGRKE